MLNSNNRIHKLALYGGSKLRKLPMPPRKLFGQAELKAVQGLFYYYWKKGVDFGYQGKYEKMYNKAFVEYMGGRGFSDAVSSGTAALYVAIAVLNLKPLSHIMVSPVTDPGTLNAIILNQLIPVVADSMPGSFNMGSDEFYARLSNKIRAAVIVHIGGKAAPVDKICNIARKKKIYIIEDCSQSHGAKLGGRKVGAFGDIATFSTMYRKNHATGGSGGVVFTQKKKYYESVRAHADRGKPFFKPGFTEKNPSTFMFPALNFNSDELSCVLGIKTLAKLDSMVKRRIDFLFKLGASIAKNSRVCRSSEVSIDDSPFFHTIKIDTSRIFCSKEEFANAVKAEGIDINPDYKYVVCEWKWIKPYLADNFISKNAINLRKSSFNLLFNENYGKKEIGDIVGAINKAEDAFTKR